MKISFKTAGLGLAVMLLTTGCGYSTPKYSMSIENAKKFKQVSQKSTTKINVGQFQSSGQDGFIMCRVAGTINTPNGKSYSEFIKDAIDAELTISDLQDTSGLVLSADLKKIELASNPINAYWDIQMMFDVNGEKFEVGNMYNFNAAFNAEEACNQSANAFQDAVQGVVSSLASHPTFIKAMTNTKK